MGEIIFLIQMHAVSFFVIALSSVLIGVPYLSVHKKQAKKMMELADLKPGMTVIDLGSGVGNLLFLAAEKGVKAIGYELNPFLVLINKIKIIVKRKNDKVSVKLKSIYHADVKEADVVFMFLMDKPMKKLEEKIFNEMKSGSLIISYTFPFPNKQPILKEQGIFVYKV